MVRAGPPVHSAMLATVWMTCSGVGHAALVRVALAGEAGAHDRRALTIGSARPAEPSR